MALINIVACELPRGQFDFKSRKVNLTGYSLNSSANNGDFLTEWVIEGSDNGSKWDQIDSRSTRDLNGNNIVKTYQCNKNNKKSYRYIRLRQIVNSSRGSNHEHYLNLAEIEFFGQLI